MARILKTWISLSRLFALVLALAFIAPVYAATYTYSNIQVPGSKFTGAFGINNKGQIVGYYEDSKGAVHGFLLSNGKYKSFDYPGAIGGTIAYGINDAGVIVGRYNNGRVSEGFAYANGKFASIHFPNSAMTLASGINRAGQIVGYYIDANNTNHGFEWQDGTYKKINVPNSSQTLAVGINTAGDISGTFYDAAGQHGFLLRHGIYHAINLPGSASTTNGSGLNDKDFVVGNYKDPKRQSFEGFVTNEVNFQELVVPGSVTTFPAGINNSDVIVGVYFNGGVNSISFVAKP